MYFIFAIFFLLQASAQYPPSSEYKVKAGFLFQYTKLLEWPSSSFENSDDPFIIAIAGEDPLGIYLDDTVTGEKVKGHPIVIQLYRLVKKVKNCHILSISNSKVFDFKKHMNKIPVEVLTVGEAAEFNAIGGMIRFITKDSKIKLIINHPAVKAAEIYISSKLLSVAEIFIKKLYLYERKVLVN